MKRQTGAPLAAPEPLGHLSEKFQLLWRALVRATKGDDASLGTIRRPTMASQSRPTVKRDQGWGRVTEAIRL